MIHISMCCPEIYKLYLVFLVPVYVIHYQNYSCDTDKMFLFTLFKKCCNLGESL